MMGTFQRRSPKVWLLPAVTVVLAGLVAAGTGHVLESSQARDGPRAAALFKEVAFEVGLNFRHFTGATGQYYFPENMGAGVALLDYDNDGDLDVYLAQGTMLGQNQRPLFP